MKPTVLFLCPHGAAKSVIATAYCRKLAIQNALDLHVVSAGTEPEPVPSPTVVSRLQQEGMDMSWYIPGRVTRHDLENAAWIVSLGCDIDALIPPGVKVIYWDDVPPPSQDLDGACLIIQEHVIQLLKNVRKELASG